MGDFWVGLRGCLLTILTNLSCQQSIRRYPHWVRPLPLSFSPRRAHQYPLQGNPATSPEALFNFLNRCLHRLRPAAPASSSINFPGFSREHIFEVQWVLFFGSLLSSYWPSSFLVAYLLPANWILGVKMSKVIITSLQTNQSCPLDLTHQSLSSYRGIQVRVFLYEGFVTDEECDHLLALVSDKLDKPLVTENSTGNASAAAVSSHNGFELARGFDEVIVRIEERMSAWTFLPIENGEDMRISYYRANADSKPSQFNHTSSEDVISEFRIATILIFLSNVSRGGEIIFPNSKIQASNAKKRRDIASECSSSTFAVKQVKASALLIFNFHPNATVDDSSLHHECLVLEGEKWSATKRIRARTFDRKKQLPDSYVECTDEDDNCRQWAAMGECQRNAVYMLGTPDYYGSCRKSCGVC